MTIGLIGAVDIDPQFAGGIEIDDLSLDQAMRNLAQRNRMNLDQFRSALLQQGIDYVTFRDQVRTEMLIGQVTRRAVETNVQVSDKEIDALIESQQDSLNAKTEYRLAHILIQLPTDPTPDDIEKSKNEIEEIRSKAVGGESFTQLAISHSHAQDALEGGDLGWRNRNQMPEMFARQLSKMQPGEISNVLRSGSGFHIFRILDVRGNDRIMVEQLLARHILIRTNAVRDDAEVEQDLQGLRNRILNGEDFAELARVHSEDPASAVDGGELGWLAPSVFAPAFREVATSIDLNDVSWMNSMGVGALMRCLTTVKNKEGDLRLSRLTDKARSIFVMTQLIRVFQIHETIDQGIESFK